jgi:acetyl esterase
MARDWIVQTASRGRSTAADAVLDRQVAVALEYQRMMRVPRLETMDPITARAHAERNLGLAELDPRPMAHITDATVSFNRVPVRIYVPHDASRNWLVWCHGGGGVIGSIHGADPVVRYIAARTRCTVASVGYRLGPEDPHPAGIEDACDAWEALVSRVPAGGCIAVGGDSFGGFLSIQVDRTTRMRGIRQPDAQLLVYPMADLTMSSPSVDRFAEGYLLTKPMMSYFREHYLGDAEDVRADSPLFWPDLEGTSPSIVATAGFDPIVDEGDRWVERLREAGVAVRHHRYDSLIHGFMSLAGIVDAARLAIDELCDDLVQLLG